MNRRPCRHRVKTVLAKWKTLWSAVSIVAATAFLTVTSAAGEVTFGRDVLPILERSCLVCHQGSGAQNGLRVATVDGLLVGGESGPAVVPGDPDNSLILTKASGDNPTMPPVGNHLTTEEIQILRDWISSGAVGGSEGVPAASQARWWSLQPLAESSSPIPTGAWARTQIDGWLLARMQEKGLTPSGPADRQTLIRRLSFDLTGLPPDPEEVKAFIHDPGPRAYERLVDRTLASPAYGERWGRHWLDVARFGESNGYEQNHLRANAWPYRDWVIDSLNEDKPFDRMIVEQLAGDRIAPEEPDVQAATGFLVAGPHDTVGIRSPEGEAQKRANHLDDMIMATTSAFLGLTVHCARCHDHKFDPIQTQDYYRMQSALAGVWHGQRTWDSADRIRAYEAVAKPLSDEIERTSEGLRLLREEAVDRIEERRSEVLAGYRASVSSEGTEEVFAPVMARFVRMTISASTRGGSQVDLDEVAVWTAGRRSRNAAPEGRATASSTRVDSASPDTYSPSNLVDGAYDKRWISAGGLPTWVQIELSRPEQIKRVEWSSDRLGGFRGRFARPQPEDYEIAVSMDGMSWKTVATSEGRLPFSKASQESLLMDAVFTPEERQSWQQLEQSRRTAEQQFNRLERPRVAFLGRFVEPDQPTRVMLRGDPMRKQWHSFKD